MTGKLTFNNKVMQFDLAKPLDISMPLTAGENNANCYWAEPVKFEVIRSGNFVGSVAEGGSVDYKQVTFTPHGNGTHTECYGHISDAEATINQELSSFHFIAEVVTVAPIDVDGDMVILQEHLAAVIKQQGIDAVVIRTPNDTGKLTRKYSGTNPPYLEGAAASYLATLGIKHLLIDLPSVDKEVDGGKLASHKGFWYLDDTPRGNCSITELIFVPDRITDGLYLLNLQIASFELDASPSKPVLYALNNIQDGE